MDNEIQPSSKTPYELYSGGKKLVKKKLVKKNKKSNLVLQKSEKVLKEIFPLSKIFLHLLVLGLSGYFYYEIYYKFIMNQEENKCNICLDNFHISERIDWCAISSGNYTFNGRKFSCGSISNVTHNPKTYTFTDGYFDSMPQLLTRCSTFNGSDPCNTRNEQPVQFTVRLQEDTCKDPETNHVNENVDFIAIEDA